MGAVYKAVDENLDISVAVKENLFMTDEYARQFQREANILASLHHPALPRVGDYFAVPTQGQYLIMDYIDGEDLRQRIERQGTLSDKEVILIGASMCEALAYLHTRKPPIIHRDIKPGNIKITPEGHARLVDFGLAKIMVGGEQTTTGARAMTPGYSPPEQYGTAPTDARTDIYSLGATLYAALTGIIPEDGLARATGKAELTPMRELNPKISRRLALTIETALAVDSDHRYQTAEQFRDALLDVGNIEKAPDWRMQIIPPPPPVAVKTSEGGPASGEGAAVGPPEGQVIKKAPRSSVRRRKPSPLLPAAVVFMAAITVYFLVGSESYNPLRSLLFPAINQPTTTQIDEPTRMVQAATPDEVEESVAPTLDIDDLTPAATFAPTEAPTITPSPTATPFGGGTGQIAFASNRTGSMQIWLMNIDGSQQHPITNLPDGACDPTWSPDGQAIAFVSDQGGVWAVWAIDPDGAHRRKLFNIGEQGLAMDWQHERISWGP